MGQVYYNGVVAAGAFANSGRVLLLLTFGPAEGWEPSTAVRNGRCTTDRRDDDEDGVDQETWPKLAIIVTTG